MALSAGAVEYTDCVSAEGYNYSNGCPRDDTKQSDGEDPVILGFWGMRGTSLLPSLPDLLWHGVVTPDSPIYGPNRTKLCTYANLNCLK